MVVLIHKAGNLDDQRCIRMTDEAWNSVIVVNGSKVTKWGRPVPAFSEYSIEAFFTTWEQEKGSN